MASSEIVNDEGRLPGENHRPGMFAYINGVVRHLAEVRYRDPRGQPVTEFDPSEIVALMDLHLAVDQAQEAPLRHAMFLGPGARKFLILYGAVLPLIEEDARRRNRHVVFLAPDGAGAAASYFAFRTMKSLTQGRDVAFATWDELKIRSSGGARAPDLAESWVIGDLDWSHQAMVGDAKEGVLAVVHRVLENSECPALFLHEQDQPSVIPFPPPLGGHPPKKTIRSRFSFGPLAFLRK